MFEYSKNIITTAKNYNMQERDVIFCLMIAAGIDRADAYHVLYNRGQNLNRQTRITTDATATDYYNNHPAFKLLVAKIKNAKPINTTSTQQEVTAEVKTQLLENQEQETPRQAELKTRSGLINRTARELATVHGKDAINGLISLAKLQGYDKEDNRTEEEKRRYFLPYRSRCRGCKLMHFYRDLEDKTQDDTKTESEK